MDGVSSRILDSQEYEFENDVPNHQKVKFIFQVDLAPHETRTFYILDATALPAVPPRIVKTFARFVPERFDDFAWESDRIAHRIYGQALIKAEGTISSGADVWIKKDRGLIVDTMYATKHYHEDNGSFMADYRVGKSRGDGGLGIWDGKKLFVSSNWKTWKLITTGPIRSEFELTYDAWDAGNGRMVSEVKRFSIDAGSWMTKVSSTISSEDKAPLTIGVGAVPGARRTPINESPILTKIPTLPISYGDAQPLLAALAGPMAPEAWRGALPIPYRIGAGPAKAHLNVSFNWDTKPLYDVIAKIPGSTFPDEWVIRGNHHDAWVNGANDPVSGMSPELEEARSLGHQASKITTARLFIAHSSNRPTMISCSPKDRQTARRNCGSDATLLNQFKAWRAG